MCAREREGQKIIYFIYHVFLHFLLHNKFSLFLLRVSKEKILRVVKKKKLRKKGEKKALNEFLCTLKKKENYLKVIRLEKFYGNLFLLTSHSQKKQKERRKSDSILE